MPIVFVSTLPLRDKAEVKKACSETFSDIDTTSSITGWLESMGNDIPKTDEIPLVAILASWLMQTAFMHYTMKDVVEARSSELFQKLYPNNIEDIKSFFEWREQARLSLQEE